MNVTFKLCLLPSSRSDVIRKLSIMRSIHTVERCVECEYILVESIFILLVQILSVRINEVDESRRKNIYHIKIICTSSILLFVAQ